MDMIGSGACVCVCVQSNVINTNLQSYTFRYFLWLLLFLIKILLVLNSDINIVCLQVVCAKRLSLCFTFHIFRSLNVKRVQLQYHRVTFFSLSVYACGICYKFSHAASPFYSCFTDRRGGEKSTHEIVQQNMDTLLTSGNPLRPYNQWCEHVLRYQPPPQDFMITVGIQCVRKRMWTKK